MALMETETEDMEGVRRGGEVCEGWEEVCVV